VADDFGDDPAELVTDRDDPGPVPGGSANPYEYCHADAVNCVDLDGKRARRGWCQYMLNWCLSFNRRTHRSYWSPVVRTCSVWGRWWSLPYAAGLIYVAHKYPKVRGARWLGRAGWFGFYADVYCYIIDKKRF
jgi:hypothetical protein